MRISFFEEFPTKKNLEKLKLIHWPTKLYLAAKSLKEFEKMKKENKKYTQVKEWIYWPVLEKKEGYWISSFSKKEALLRIFSELQEKNIPVMLDLELPTTQNPLLYLTQSISFWSNKKIIKEFIEKYKGIVYLAEYYPERKCEEKVMEKFGIHYKNKRVKIIKMLYHSLHNFNKNFLENELRRGKREFKDNYLVAYGLISSGVEEKEALLRPEILEQDLLLAQKEGISEVVMFRLGGLNKKYLEVMEKFL